MEDAYNLSMRKFLKQVGVTSQGAIEEALRSADNSKKSYSIKAVVTIEELDMVHEVTGKISAKE